jgi:CHAT domain-containing protein
VRLAVRAVPTTRSAAGAILSDLPPLPETADEVRAIAAALGAGPESIFLGARASERSVKEREHSARRVILFATHGLVPGDIDGLGQPSLAMSNPTVTGGEGDGLLTLEEILALDLDADWVILSACNTGAGDGRGAEAVSGLGRAFFYAGARALLVSNWPVHSEATKELTTSMMAPGEDLRGRSRAELHRLAMARMVDKGVFRDTSGNAVFSYAHPVFSAPFSVVGDGRGSTR